MSQRDSGYARKERDLYETPEWVTDAVCKHIRLTVNGIIWEPAAGSGKMAKVLRSTLGGVRESDISTGVDFLTVSDRCAREHGIAAIVTNPPYDSATEFCAHALRLMEPVAGVVAMLLRTDFDHAKSRSHLFRDCPAFAKKLVLTKRIVWFEPEPGAKGKSPSFNHAWFIWDWQHEGAPTLAYGP